MGVLAAPLRLRELSIQGRGPPPSYEGKITVLDEGQGSLDSEGNFTLQVLVTGGYLHGGCRLGVPQWRERDIVGVCSMRKPG